MKLVTITADNVEHVKAIINDYLNIELKKYLSGDTNNVLNLNDTKFVINEIEHSYDESGGLFDTNTVQTPLRLNISEEIIEETQEQK